MTTPREIFNSFKENYDISDIVELSDENLLELCEYFASNQDDEALNEMDAWNFAYMMYCNFSNEDYEIDANGTVYM